MRRFGYFMPVILLGGASYANASTNALGLAGSFNALIFGNANTGGGHADGAVGVAGNWTGSGYLPAQSNLLASDGTHSDIGMLVDGNVNFSNGGSLNNGAGYVAGSFTTQNPFGMNSHLPLQVGGSYSGPSNSYVVPNVGSSLNDSAFFSSEEKSLKSLSTSLDGLTGSAVSMPNSNNWYLDGSTQAGSLKVFDITGSQLNNLATLDLQNIASTDTILINVTGSVSNFGVTLNANYDKVLWNFTDATEIGIYNRAFHGTILAPYANVDQSQNIDGGLYAASWNNYNSAELHYGLGKTFDGNLPSTPSVPAPAAALSMGIVAISSFIRRKRA